MPRVKKFLGETFLQVWSVKPNFLSRFIGNFAAAIVVVLDLALTLTFQIGLSDLLGFVDVIQKLFL